MPDRITIRPEDLKPVAPPPASPPIRLEVPPEPPPTLGVGEPAKRPSASLKGMLSTGEARVEPLVKPKPAATPAPANAQMPFGLLLLLTAIPGVNAWAWFRRARTDRTKRPLALVFAVLLTVVNAALVLLGVVYAAVPHSTWIERVAHRSETGVVRIVVGDHEGSGFVVASRGKRHLVMTNKHVLTGIQGRKQKASNIPKQCEVVLHTGQKINGDVVGTARDEEIDLALVLIEAEGPSPLGSIASYDSVQVGEQVIAVGHPLGLEYTVTSGIVSAKRGLLLQTSTPINPGNSGGPLIDERERVIGVNTWIVSPEQGQGLGFAVRADVLAHHDEWHFSTDISDLLSRVSLTTW